MARLVRPSEKFMALDAHREFGQNGTRIHHEGLERVEGQNELGFLH